RTSDDQFGPQVRPWSTRSSLSLSSHSAMASSGSTTAYTTTPLPTDPRAASIVTDSPGAIGPAIVSSCSVAAPWSGSPAKYRTTTFDAGADPSLETVVSSRAAAHVPSSAAATSIARSGRASPASTGSSASLLSSLHSVSVPAASTTTETTSGSVP